MKSLSRIVAVLSLVVAGSALAQESGVTTSTDPAKAAAIEQRAAQMRAQQPAEPAPAVRHARKHPGKHVRKHAPKAHKPRHMKKPGMPAAPAAPAPAPAK